MPATSIREFADNAVEPKVRGFLHQPELPNYDGMVLSHGAGSNAAAALLVALAETFSAQGVTVLRCDLPYRQARSFGPPGPGDAARDRAGLTNALAAMRKVVSGRLFLGGHSYGGRQSTILVSEDSQLVDGLLLLSYPLHPPRKPAQLRTSHFPKLETPSFFVHGTRDPFGTIPEMKSAIEMIPAGHVLLEVEGAGHDLVTKKTLGELPARVVSEFQTFVKK